MRPKQFLLILITLFIVLLLIVPNGLPAAVNNNIWSIVFVNKAYLKKGIDPKSFSPPQAHKDAPLLLANQALKQGDLALAGNYLQMLMNSSSPHLRHTAANISFLSGNVEEAVRIWKSIGKWHTLEQVSRVLEGDEKIIAFQAAYELKPETYERSLINALFEKVNLLLESNQDDQIINIYNRILSIDPDNQRAKSALESLENPDE